MIRKFQKDTESTSEYILPDYLGDVKKLVLTSARVVPSGLFEGEEETECTGIVSYDIVYLDSENKLSAASFSSDYDFSIKKDSESYIDSFVTSQVSNFGVRLTGPRRMIAKANVQSDVTQIESWAPKFSDDSFEKEELEKISKTVNIESGIKAEGLEREYAEELASLEGVSGDDIEVISANAYVRISETIPVENGVNIKGELVVTAIIRTPDTSVFAIKREIPFDETVSISGAGADMSAISDAVVSSLSMSVSESENSSVIIANVIMDFSAMALYNESVEVVLDAYVKTKDSIAEYENFDFTTFCDAETKCGSVSLKIPLSSLDASCIKEILTLNQDYRGLVLENDKKTAKFAGEIAFSGVACEISEDGEENITNIKFATNAVFDVNNSCHNLENAKIFAKISPAGCEWEIDGENLNLVVWYSVTYTVGEENSVKYLISCEASGDAEYQSSSSHVRVYYPDENETLFEIAKKFHTAVKDIAADNMISEPTALGVPSKAGFKRLIIR